MSDDLYDHPGWEWTTFEGARRDILLGGLRTSFREKLEWLEEAETLALRLRSARERRASSTTPGKARGADLL
jgi:hypothetical protein